MDETETTVETTLSATLLVVRPGDALFVMPETGEFWTAEGMNRIAAIIKEQLPEARVIVLPTAAAFTTVAIEDRDDARQP